MTTNSSLTALWPDGSDPSFIAFLAPISFGVILLSTAVLCFIRRSVSLLGTNLVASLLFLIGSILRAVGQHHLENVKLYYANLLFIHLASAVLTLGVWQIVIKIFTTAMCKDRSSQSGWIFGFLGAAFFYSVILIFIGVSVLEASKETKVPGTLDKTDEASSGFLTTLIVRAIFNAILLIFTVILHFQCARSAYSRRSLAIPATFMYLSWCLLFVQNIGRVVLNLDTEGNTGFLDSPTWSILVFEYLLSGLVLCGWNLIDPHRYIQVTAFAGNMELEDLERAAPQSESILEEENTRLG